MGLKGIRLTESENLDNNGNGDSIDTEFTIIEIRNQNLREEFKGLPNNSISEYLHSIGEIKPE